VDHFVFNFWAGSGVKPYSFHSCSICCFLGDPEKGKNNRRRHKGERGGRGSSNGESVGM